MTSSSSARSNILAQALNLADLGLPCFPCASDKKPTTPHGFNDATCARGALVAMWGMHPGPLIGVRTGAASGLDVLDIDVRHRGGEWYGANRHILPPTRVHRTRSGGLHLLFQHRHGLRCSSGRIASGVDVRADGGYVIWWPAAGFPVLSDQHPARWPAWLDVKPPLERMPAPRRMVVPNEYALVKLIRMVADAPQGQRNNLTFWAACRAGEMVASGMFSADTAAAVITDAATRAGLPFSEAERTAWSGIRASGGVRS